MTEPRFEELINLYLDNEIGRHELGELKHAIRDNVLRRQKFERACQLHQAARKALTSREEEVPANANQAVEANATAKPMVATSSSRSARPSRSNTGGPGSLRHKQSQANRNASVATLAERQLGSGAASSVDVTKINLESSNAPRLGQLAKNFTFFDSPLGMTMAGFFTLVGVGILYLMLRVVVPNQDEVTGAPTGDSLIGSPSSPVDQKELMRELQKGRGASNPAEAMHANIYQAAAGQPATNQVVTSNTTAQNAVGSSNATQPSAVLSVDAAANATSTSVEIQNSSSTAAGNNQLMVNSPDLHVTLPTVSGMPGNQDEWVKISLPPLVTPPANGGNQDKPANETLPQVSLP